METQSTRQASHDDLIEAAKHAVRTVSKADFSHDRTDLPALTTAELANKAIAALEGQGLALADADKITLRRLVSNFSEAD